MSQSEDFKFSSCLSLTAGLYSCVAAILGLIGFLYLGHFQISFKPLDLFYFVIAYTGHFLLMAFLPWLIIVILFCVIPFLRKAAVPAAIVSASFLISLVLLDSLVFSSNRFHFSVLTARILGFKTWGFGIFYLIIAATILGQLVRYIRRFCNSKKLWPVWTFIAGYLVFSQAITHSFHMWADANAYTPITRLTPHLPFFYPAVGKRFMQRYGLVKHGRTGMPQISNNTAGRQHGFKYPAKELVFEKEKPALNLLFLIIDDMRADMLTDTTSPILAKLAREEGIRFYSHYSGGNSTRAGLFSLFYGLPATYWQYIQSNNIEPVMIEILRSRGYRFGIFTSAPLNAPAELDATAFSRIPNLRIKTSVPGGRGYARDSAITAEWTHWLDTSDAKKPFFGFLMYDNLCTHDIAPVYHKVDIRLSQVDKYEKERLYDEIQSRFVDSLVCSVISDIKMRGLKDSTVIIVSADHGEEYDDNKLGFSGHGSAYSKWQLHVPFIVLWPGKPALEVVERRTSHFDVSATIISEMLGCINPVSDVCSGNNLFTGPQWNWLITGSYYNDAIIEPNQVTIKYPGGYFEVRDEEYKVVSNSRMNPAVLGEAFKEAGRFFQNK